MPCIAASYLLSLLLVGFDVMTAQKVQRNFSDLWEADFQAQDTEGRLDL